MNLDTQSVEPVSQLDGTVFLLSGFPSDCAKNTFPVYTVRAQQPVSMLCLMGISCLMEIINLTAHSV